MDIVYSSYEEAVELIDSFVQDRAKLVALVQLWRDAIAEKLSDDVVQKKASEISPEVGEFLARNPGLPTIVMVLWMAITALSQLSSCTHNVNYEIDVNELLRGNTAAEVKEQPRAVENSPSIVQSPEVNLHLRFDDGEPLTKKQRKRRKLRRALRSAKAIVDRDFDELPKDVSHDRSDAAEGSADDQE